MDMSEGKDIFIMDLQGKNVLVAGCGISGMASAKLLAQIGAKVILFDTNEKLQKEDILHKLDKDIDVEIVLGNIDDKLASGLELVVLSPGIPVDADFVNDLREKGLPIWGEIELAYQFAKGRIAAITGTNGKTTTTALTGEIMRNYFKSVFVVGNIGNAYTKEALYTVEDSVTVAEISSFQLETIHDFLPHVAAILNITPDHLNRHHTMEAYVEAKESIVKNQTMEDYCVLNYEDAYTRDFGKRAQGKVIWFSSGQKLENGFYLDEDVIYKAVDGKAEALFNTAETKLLGVHNMENIMAAIAICDAFGVPMDSIVASVKAFRAVEHRIEYVATKRGVDYYNDSKGTNPDAAIKGIQAMNKPTILIGGGYDKDSTYDEWIESFDGKVKLFVLIGQTREKIAECAKAHGMKNIVLAESFEEAMDICIKESKAGDAVLLSPACASWGMFPNYEVRGNRFKEIVHSIEE